MIQYKLLFTTELGKYSMNRVCLFKDKDSYVFLDISEEEQYREAGYKDSPTCFEEEIDPIFYSDDLLVKKRGRKKTEKVIPKVGSR